jgi:hypothetical protein
MRFGWIACDERAGRPSPRCIVLRGSASAFAFAFVQLKIWRVASSWYAATVSIALYTFIYM